MTPYEIKLLLHFYTTTAEYPGRDALIYGPTVEDFIKAGLIIKVSSMCSAPIRDSRLECSERGEAMVKLLCATPLPEKVWVDGNPGWYADRLHAAAGEGSSNAICGFSFPRVLPDAEWFKKKLSNEPPKCKKCSRQLEKLGQLRSKTKETARPKRCRWVEFDMCIWKTECGYKFESILDATPQENSMKYCPYCGGDLVTDETKGE